MMTYVPGAPLCCESERNFGNVVTGPGGSGGMGVKVRPSSLVPMSSSFVISALHPAAAKRVVMTNTRIDHEPNFANVDL